jgi:hypothetical protein
MEYFFESHFNKTLVNTHQVEYIDVIGSEHYEIILKSFLGGSVKEAIKRTE